MFSISVKCTSDRREGVGVGVGGVGVGGGGDNIRIVTLGRGVGGNLSCGFTPVSILLRDVNTEWNKAVTRLNYQRDKYA